MAIGIPMFKILPSMIPGSLEGSFILKMRWATPGQLTLVNPLDDNALKWTLNKIALGLANSCEKRMSQRTGNINPWPLTFGDKGEKSRFQWHQICLPVSYLFTSQELWALSSLKSNISLAAQLECLGRRYALVCQQVHTGTYLATAQRLKVPIWVTKGSGYVSKTDRLVASGKNQGVFSADVWSLRKLKDVPPELFKESLHELIGQAQNSTQKTIPTRERFQL